MLFSQISFIRLVDSRETVTQKFNLLKTFKVAFENKDRNSHGLFIILLGQAVCFKHATQLPACEVLLMEAMQIHVFLCYLETRKRFSPGDVFV